MITWNSSVGPETDGFQSEIIKQKLLKTQKQLTGTRQFSDVDLIEGSQWSYVSCGAEGWWK